MGMSKRVGKTYKYWWLTGTAKHDGVSRRGVLELLKTELGRGDIIVVRRTLFEYVDFEQTPQGWDAWVRTLSPSNEITGLTVMIMLQELEDTLHQRGKPKRWKKKP
jgi:hypothetical protein